MCFTGFFTLYSCIKNKHFSSQNHVLPWDADYQVTGPRMTQFLDLQQNPLRDLNQNYTCIWAMHTFWVLSCGSEVVPQAHLAPSAKSWGLLSALPIYSSVNHASQPRSGLWADTWDEFTDSKSGAVPAFCGRLAAPEIRVAGGHLLSRPWLCCVCSIKMYSLEPRQPEKATSAKGMAHPHVLGRTKHLSSSPRGLSPHSCPCAMWGVPEQGLGLLTPRRASLMSSLQMWQGANVTVRVRHLKGRHSGAENIRQVQTANVMCRSLQKIRKWRNDCVLLHFVKLSHHKWWKRASTQDRAYQGLVLGNQQEQNFKIYLKKWKKNHLMYEKAT